MEINNGNPLDQIFHLECYPKESSVKTTKKKTDHQRQHNRLSIDNWWSSGVYNLCQYNKRQWQRVNRNGNTFYSVGLIDHWCYLLLWPNHPCKIYYVWFISPTYIVKWYIQRDQISCSCLFVPNLCWLKGDEIDNKQPSLIFTSEDCMFYNLAKVMLIFS